MLQTSLLLMKSLNKTETPIFLSVVCSLFPKAIFLTFIVIIITMSAIHKMFSCFCFIFNIYVLTCDAIFCCKSFPCNLSFLTSPPSVPKGASSSTITGGLIPTANSETMLGWFKQRRMVA